MLCVAIKGPSPQEVEEQIEEARLYADIVELRLDIFETIDNQFLQQLRKQYPLPMIFTLRKASQGGYCCLPEEERLEKILSLAQLSPEYIDVESDVNTAYIELMQKQYPHIKVIVSYHHFEKPFPDIADIYADMQRLPAAFYKLTVTVENAVQALQLLLLAQQAQGELIAIGMGDHGQLTRIAGPIVGMPITYAALNPSLATASGQLCAQELCEKYRFAFLTAKTSIWGLIGDPVNGSISDDTHNALLQHFNIDGIYIKIALQASLLNEFLALAKRLPFKGLSVTMPLKERILQFLHRENIEKKAAEMKAVNTLQFVDDEIFAYNTDAKAALDIIEKRCNVKDKHIVIIGSGGSARAIAVETLRRKAHVTLTNRNFDKAQDLAIQLQCASIDLHDTDKWSCFNYDILINSTPASLPIEETMILPHTLVMDIKTKPKHSPFSEAALKKQCQVIYGFEMFVEQAIGQFDIWFQSKLDKEECRACLLTHIELLK